MMDKFLYLTEPSWVSSWVDGGPAPLNCASTYRRFERQGVYTPDENLIDNSNQDVRQFGNLSLVEDAAFTLYGGSINGVPVSGMFKFDRKIEDGVVLCLSNRRSNYIAKRLGKKACVRIFDINKLKTLLDEQIGISGIMDTCRYTKSHNRNHFLKSYLDSWQDEYRIFWPNVSSVTIQLPKNIAIQVPIRGQILK
ncbi:hypothetical protein [Raoultella ornithinolytica]|uniref:hypothetical protein n=1 Tax=Raoultella ornithinolytica TaxID=54291 RepID=UPI001D0D4891|nr:hypothetical protein [Raoultella ornithinolytica]